MLSHHLIRHFVGRTDQQTIKLNKHESRTVNLIVRVYYTTAYFAIKVHGRVYSFKNLSQPAPRNNVALYKHDSVSGI